jgi:TATA element modulatory factor
MASSSSAKGGGTRWGSLLSQAVAGVEARLDTILSEGDDSTRSQEQKEQKPAAKPAAASQPAKTSALASLPLNFICVDVRC